MVARSYLTFSVLVVMQRTRAACNKAVASALRANAADIQARAGHVRAVRRESVPSAGCSSAQDCERSHEVAC